MVPPIVPTSFGDIVAAVRLIHQIYQALSDSAGTSAEYQCLISELRSFANVLNDLDLTLNEISPCESNRQAIQAETDECYKLLQKLWYHIQPYEAVLTDGRWYYNIWPKVVWAIFKPAKVARFRQKISQHMNIINSYVQTMGMRMNHSNGRKLDKLTQQQQPLQDNNYYLSNALILIDALGEHIPLDMQLCFSPDVHLSYITFNHTLTYIWQKFHETLIHLFKGKIGQSHVERHDYRISTKDGKSIVELDNWGSIVKKGSVIVMGIIVKKTPQDSSERSICPRCHKTEVGVMLDDGWMQCRRCSKRFTCVDKTTQDPQSPSQEENIADFRNLHVVLVKKEMMITITPPPFDFDENDYFDENNNWRYHHHENDV